VASLAEETRRPSQRPGLALSWSGGKGSALALLELQRRGTSPRALVTTVTGRYDTVALHGVDRRLVTRQAALLGIPLVEIELQLACPNDDYEAKMARAFSAPPLDAVDAVAFGDVDGRLRAYREERLTAGGRHGAFPLWGRGSARLAAEFLAAGFEATVVCVDPRRLDPSFAGRAYDADLLAQLPDGVDPWGARGEFHTFVHAGPLFAEPIRCRPGAPVERDGYVFRDLVDEA
jgi:uncharacterized protein (TIGR00290 family)